MDQQHLQLIKSLHVISHLPIYIFDERLNLKHLYVADRVEILPYDFEFFLKNIILRIFYFPAR